MMDKVSYQNGLVCGLALKGLALASEMYSPNIWNDAEDLTYIYIDFRHTLLPISLGMFNESVLIYGNSRITPTKIEIVSAGLYRIYCNVSTEFVGITVMNKVDTVLRLSTGEVLPSFIEHTYINGIDRYEKAQYIYEAFAATKISDPIVKETFLGLVFWESIDPIAISENVMSGRSSLVATETHSIALN